MIEGGCREETEERLEKTRKERGNSRQCGKRKEGGNKPYTVGSRGEREGKVESREKR